MAKQDVASSEKGMVVYEAKGDRVQLSPQIVRNFLVTGKKELVTDQEIYYFLSICKARKLNPFTKDCYLIKYSQDPAAIVTAIDFYRSRAKAQPDCVGWEAGVICQDKKTNELRYSHGLVLETENVVGGWFKGQPTGWSIPFNHEVNLKEYQKTTSDGKVTKFWQNPAMMIAKVAESQGLRTLWPDEFHGTYTAEERGFDENTIDITPVAEISTKKEPEPGIKDFLERLREKNLSKEQSQAFNDWLTKQAENKKVTIGQYQARVMELGKFEPMFAAFMHTYPTQQPEVAPDSEPEGDEGEGQGEEQEGSGEANPLEERIKAVWSKVIAKGVPLTLLGVESTKDLHDGNIDEVEAAVEAYGGKKKK